MELLLTVKENLDQLNCMKNQNQTCTAEHLDRILCMQGGEEDSSYANNSYGPASAIKLSKPLLAEAIQLMTLFKEESLRIADLGCATGYNTLATIDFVVENLRERYTEECGMAPEFEVFFCDLPSNDFNSLFNSLPSFTDGKKNWYYAAGVPGSFYHRLFPKGKLHVVVSLSALNWLSQIPENVLDKKSPAWNEGRAWIDGAKREVGEAYAKQSEEDLKAFLRCRREEMAEGGLLFLTMGGRPSWNCPENQLADPNLRPKHAFTNSMDQAWEDLLTEGLIDQDTRDRFNIPVYMRSTTEVEKAFEECQGFDIQRIEYQTFVEPTKEKHEEWIKDPVSFGRAQTNLARAGLSPLVAAHIGPELSVELFKRFEKRVSQDMSVIHKTCFYGLIVVSAIRR